MVEFGGMVIFDDVVELYCYGLLVIVDCYDWNVGVEDFLWGVGVVFVGY